MNPAELAKLEHAFATDPASEAYRPLAEAYLGMGRFMEAMVVCKKGVKAHPDAPDPRVLLARVYAEQGKDKKALEELQSALQAFPSAVGALRLQGVLQLRGGDLESGRANLLKAYELDPSDQETLAALTQHNVKPASGAPPAVASPTPAPTAPPSTRDAAGPSARAQSPAPSEREGASPARSAPEAPARPARPAPPASVNGASRDAPSRPARAPAAARPVYADEEDLESDPDVQPYRPRGRHGSRKSSLLLAGAVLLGISGYAIFRSTSRVRNQEINKQLRKAEELLRHDSYASYLAATDAAARVIEELDSSNTKAHGDLAYAYAIRWGEHGGGDDVRQKAEHHLAEARRGVAEGEVSSQLYAAEALYRTYSGKGTEAARALEEVIQRFRSRGNESPQLYLTLGLIQMNQGDLERARESLLKSQQLAPADPRVYSALGTLFRRRGQDADALRNLDNALRYETDHPEAMLGKALLLLEQDEPRYQLVARLLKKLLEANPPPSPRQLATAHLAYAFMLARLSRDIGDYKPEAQKELIADTGVSLDREKNRAEVSSQEERGFSLDRNNPELHLIKGKRLAYEGNYDAAAQAIRSAIGIDGSRAHFHVELARALMKKDGGEKEAEEALRKALAMIPDSPKLLAMLGHALNRQGKSEEAIAQYERAIADPKARNPEARYSMGLLYRDVKKDFDRAVAQFDKSAQEYVGQSYLVARSYTDLAITLGLKGDKAEAKAAFEKALNADASYAAAYYQYARFLAGEDARSERVRIKTLAKEYLRLAPKGEFANEAQRL